MTKPRKDVVRERNLVTEELREKLQSKMDVGKFFAGFITLLIGILLQDGGLDESFLPRIGIVFLISSLGFCVAAVFRYDSLLLPREYWELLPKEEKTEEKFQDHLVVQMVSSWRWLFVPAVICFGIGFLMVLAEALGLKLNGSDDLVPALLVVFLIVGVLVPILILLGVQKGLLGKQKWGC